MKHIAKSFSHLILILSVVIVLANYTFVISLGTWTQFPTTTTLYNQLANSFMQGKLWLAEQPDPRLLELSNPYDPKARSGIPYLQDASFYQGKYYLYFGPIPAVLLIPLKILTGGEYGDQLLVFSFVFGIFCVQVMLLLKIWNHYYSMIPSWAIALCIIVLGLISPLIWILSLPSIYNASIMGGQFFFLAGVATIIGSQEKTNNESTSRSMFIVGVLWASAIGSRITQAIPVSALVIIGTLWLYNLSKKNNNRLKLFHGWLAFGAAFGLGLGILGWYNWMRFGSIFESGINYQLAGPDLHKYQDVLFSPIYIAQNFYNYFLIQPDFSLKFPFLGPIKGLNVSIIPFLHLPEAYFSQETGGLFYTAPFIIFAFVPLLKLIKFRKRREYGYQPSTIELRLNRIIFIFFVSFSTNLLLFLSFFWAAVRYQGDFLPSLAFLSIIGFLQAYQSSSNHPILRIAIVSISSGLIAITTIAGNLLAFAISSARYREFNPEIWKYLIRLFQ